MALAIKSNLEGRFHVGENGVAFLRGGRGKGKVRTPFASTFLEMYQGPMHSACIQSHYRIKMPYCPSKSAGLLALRRLNLLIKNILPVTWFPRNGPLRFVWPVFTKLSNTFLLKWPKPHPTILHPSPKCNAT